MAEASEPFLQPPPGRYYVRSFLFSRRINAPLARVHLLARLLLVLCMSGVQLRTINAESDLVGAGVLWLVSLAIFLSSGMQARIARLYFLLMLPALMSLFATWIVFNPVPGHVTLLNWTIYSGHLSLSLAWWELLWLVIVVGCFLWTRKLFIGIGLATLIAILQTSLWPLPVLTLAQLSVFHPLTVFVSDRGLLVAVTKVVGYSGMVLSTVALVVTSRDAELIGALRQLRVPQPVIFFLSTVFRALDLSLSDYEIVHQAQIARAINARPRSVIRRLRDLGSIAVPMVAMMIRRSSEIGDALQARGYRLQRPNVDFYETSPWRPIDWVILIISLAFLYLTFGPLPNLTQVLQSWL